MQKRKLGNSNLEVSSIGLGCMGMSAGYGPPAEKKEMISLLRTAVERGVTFFDTAQVYGPFTNEELVGEALEPYRGRVVIATKFGFDIDANGRQRGGLNSRPEYIKQMRDAGYAGVKIDKLVQFRIHGVDEDLIRSAKAHGFNDLTADDLIDLAIHGRRWLKG